MRRCAGVVAGVVAMALVAPALALEPGKPPDPAAVARVAQLEKAGDGEKATVEHQVKLARACQDAGDTDRMADAALMAYFASEMATPAELEPVRKALAAHAKAHYDDAMRHVEAKDTRSAVKAYLQALKRDPAVLARDDAGLRAIAFEALKKSAQKTPDGPHRWKLAQYAYLFGELQTASDELSALAGSAPPELKWRIDVLRPRVERELAHAKAEDARLRSTSSGAGGGAGGGPALPDTSIADQGQPAGDPNAERRRQLQEEITKVDGLITYYSNPDGYKYNIDDSGDSRVRKFSSSGPRLQEKIDGLKKQKAELELELSNLR